MLKILVSICVLLLSVSSAYARSHGSGFSGHYNYERELSNFSRPKELVFRDNERKELGRFWSNEHNEAIRYFNAALENEKMTRHEAYQYYRLGREDMHQENYNDAIMEFTQAIEIYPELAVAYRLRGIAYYKCDEFDKALADIYKADQLESSNSSRLIDLIKGFASHQEAIASFRLGLEDRYHENFVQAIAEFTKAINTYPDMAVAYHCRGMVYSMMNELDKAMADIHRAEELGFKDNPDILNTIKDSGNLPQSIADLTLKINLNPDDPKLYFRRGVCYRKQHSYAAAIDDETKAIALDPGFGDAYRVRGASYFFEKKYNEAWADMTKARELGAHISSNLMHDLKQALGKE